MTTEEFYVACASATPIQAQSLMELPTELHLHIASYLPYPDALALKHTNRHFFSFVYTGVHLKVDWLVERFEQKLECPMEKCSFRTDEAFCNPRIRRIMERRRRHLECRPVAGGCCIIEGRTCQRAMMAIWLKDAGRLGSLKEMKSWCNEVFIVSILFMFYTALWRLCLCFVLHHAARTPDISSVQFLCQLTKLPLWDEAREVGLRVNLLQCNLQWPF